MIFTRYLYIKEEVEKALLISLLKQNKEQSLFWFNELVESGFDLEEMCEELYFDIYFTNNHNPSFLLSSSFTSIVENLIINDAKCINIQTVIFITFAVQFFKRRSQDKAFFHSRGIPYFPRPPLPNLL